MTDPTADYPRDNDCDEIVGEMETDDDSSIPSIIFPDSTTADQSGDIEGLNIGNDDVIELITPDKGGVSGNYNSYQDVDMELETIDDNTDVPAIMVTQGNSALHIFVVV